MRMTLCAPLCAAGLLLLQAPAPACASQSRAPGSCAPLRRRQHHDEDVAAEGDVAAARVREPPGLDRAYAIDTCTTLSAWSTPSSTTTRNGFARIASGTRSSAIRPRHNTTDSPPSSPAGGQPRRTATAPVPKTDLDEAATGKKITTKKEASRDTAMRSQMRVRMGGTASC